MFFPQYLGKANPHGQATPVEFGSPHEAICAGIGDMKMLYGNNTTGKLDRLSSNGHPLCHLGHSRGAIGTSIRRPFTHNCIRFGLPCDLQGYVENRVLVLDRFA
jgi:hypothetical protein